MHPRMIAQRTSDAHGRMVAAVEKLATAAGLTMPPFSAIREKSPDVQRVKEYEALADFLEALAGAQLSKPPDDFRALRQDWQNDPVQFSSLPVPPQPAEETPVKEPTKPARGRPNVH